MLVQLLSANDGGVLVEGSSSTSRDTVPQINESFDGECSTLFAFLMEDFGVDSAE